ncbi:SipW-dependent-type signal peptide-containing protein [Microbacterium sp. JZ37]|uniref:SipW-dependent-type signal peptide-containing protein n=1 Tax=Microbacterium sp. JZ37 TaxID=2654193 RepID=UPI002B4739F8|nr:SipW-dependent-type signal peptide-containing protein [Microbacterium sp. JZ37]WRH16641.1 hypothetical protein GC092_03310 [Microbacterium sp. JZ37]
MARKATRDARRRALRWRRLRAVLAGGVVLGIGAAATLAAWNDTEHTTATLTAGTFGIVGATNGTTFTEHASAGAAAVLNFQVAPTAMTPGTTTYALFSVRTVNPSVAGSVLLTATDSNATTGLGQYLTYGVRTVPAAQCDATTFGASTATVILSGSPLGADAASSQSLSANGASTVNYCFAVTLPSTAPNAAQGASVTPTWQFTATSS